MALSSILTEAEIAAGLQSCQGNIYVLNLAVQFIYQIPCYPKVPIPVETEKSLLLKTEKWLKVMEQMQVLILANQATGTHNHLCIAAILRIKKSKGWILHQKSCFFRE